MCSRCIGYSVRETHDLIKCYTHEHIICRLRMNNEFRLQELGEYKM